MLYVEPGEPVATRACPDGIEPRRPVDVAVVQVMTWPDEENPVFRAEAGPGRIERFEFSDLRSTSKFPPRCRNDGGACLPTGWTPLPTIGSDSEAAMMWGDVGDLYWLTRKGKVADGDPARTAFTGITPELTSRSVSLENVVQS